MAGRVSQAMVEVLARSAGGNARASQVMVEALFSRDQITVGGRVSQFMVEVLISRTPADPGGTTGKWYRDLSGDGGVLGELGYQW